MSQAAASTESSALRAALVLGAVLVLATRPWDSTRPIVCEVPVELASRDGLTVAVGCDPESGAAHPLRGPARLLFGGRLDLNCADARSLEALAGVGPARAAAIVAARQQRPFGSVADLARVDGIGPQTIASLADVVEVVRGRRCPDARASPEWAR